MKLTYHHPDSGKEMTQEEMLAERFQGQARFRVMGVAPKGVVVTAEMRQRVADLPVGTLVDMKNVTKHIIPLDRNSIEKVEKVDVKGYRRFTFATRKRLAESSRMVVHSESPLFPDR